MKNGFYKAYKMSGHWGISKSVISFKKTINVQKCCSNLKPIDITNNVFGIVCNHNGPAFQRHTIHKFLVSIMVFLFWRNHNDTFI